MTLTAIFIGFGQFDLSLILHVSLSLSLCHYFELTIQTVNDKISACMYVSMNGL